MSNDLKGTVLVVDDEENNLIILHNYLSNAGYEVISASGGEEAWRILQKNIGVIDVILLDRMMPKINGIDLLHLIKASDGIENIPVVMQTAATSQEEVAEGVRAGAFYYLTKPYEEELLLSIVDSAFQHHIKHSSLAKEVSDNRSIMGLVKEVSLEYQTIDQAHKMAVFVANFFPQPKKVVFGLSEMMVNAVEHGNLGISYKEKSNLDPETSWLEEIERRLKLSENINKKVKVHYSNKGYSHCVTITDDGDGFDWRAYLNVDPRRAMDGHGRGIAYARMMSFDEVIFNEKGNEVICCVFPEEELHNKRSS